MKPRKNKPHRKVAKVDAALPHPAIVYIAGEIPCVEEVSQQCANHGYQVYFSCPAAGKGKLPFESDFIRRQPRIPPQVSFALELTNVDLQQKRENLELLDRELPGSTAIVSSSVTITATEQSGWITQKHRLVGAGLNPWLSKKPLIEIAPTVFSPAETVSVVQTFFRSLGKEIEVVQDRIGLVFPRILCQMINEAAFALQEEIAEPQELDRAMKMGADYPLGPVEWAEQFGLDDVYAVLQSLRQDLGEERLRIAPLLAQMAMSGPWWKKTNTHPGERH